MNLLRRSIRLFAVALAAAVASPAMATTLNFSSIETALADPDDKDSMMTALWTGWGTQVYEYSMPFIEIDHPADAPFPISTFTLSIGDTDYNFSNEFLRKEDTNSFPYPANGEYALTGFSTPDVAFTTGVMDGGDTLVVKFLNGGLQPGERAIFQINLAPDEGVDGLMAFPNYTMVLFTANGDPDDTDDNAVARLDFTGTELFSELTLPNLEVDPSISQFFTTPRPYSVMQTIPTFPDGEFEIIPEPTTGLLALLAAAGAATRRRV